VRGGTPGEKKTKTKNNLGTDGAEEEALAKNVEGERSKRDLLLERMTHTVATYSTKAMYKQKRPIEKQKRPTTREDDTHRRRHPKPLLTQV